MLWDFQPKGFSSGSIAIPWDDAQPTTVRLEPLRVFNTNVENAVPLIATRRVFFSVSVVYGYVGSISHTDGWMKRKYVDGDGW